MSVRREKSKAICYISGHYRKPAHLKAELQGVCMVKRLTTVPVPQVTAGKKMRQLE